MTIKKHVGHSDSWVVEMGYRINEHKALKNGIDFKLATLFWQIGDELKKYFTLNNLSAKQRSLIKQEIYVWLNKNYGSLFTKKTMKQMQHLSSNYDDKALLYEYYKIAMFEEGNSDGVHTKYLLTQPKNERGVFPKVSFKISQLKILFANIIEGKSNIDFYDCHLDYKELFDDINNLIKVYTYEQNALLNSNLNQMFWNIGNCINKYRLFSEPNKVNELVQQISAMVTGKGIRLSQNEIEAMQSFAQVFQQNDFFTPICFLLSWSHIKVLLNLNSINKIAFYTKQTLQHKLSSKELERLINKNSNEDIGDLSNYSFDFLNNYFKKTDTVSTVKEGRNISTIKVSDYSFNEKANTQVIGNFFSSLYAFIFKEAMA